MNLHERMSASMATGKALADAIDGIIDAVNEVVAGLSPATSSHKALREINQAIALDGVDGVIESILAMEGILSSHMLDGSIHKNTSSPEVGIKNIIVLIKEEVKAIAEFLQKHLTAKDCHNAEIGIPSEPILPSTEKKQVIAALNDAIAKFNNHSANIDAHAEEEVKKTHIALLGIAGEDGDEVDVTWEEIIFTTVALGDALAYHTSVIEGGYHLFAQEDKREELPSNIEEYLKDSADELIAIFNGHCESEATHFVADEKNKCREISSAKNIASGIEDFYSKVKKHALEYSVGTGKKIKKLTEIES